MFKIRSLLSASTLLLGIATPLVAQAQSTSTQSELQALQQALAQQQQITQRLQQRVQALESQPAAPPPPAPTPAPAAASTTGSAGFSNGFFIQDASGNNSLHVDGLIQPRFTYFTPSKTAQVGGVDKPVSNFDIFLGRLYFSGNLIDPSITYFTTLQGTTTGNGSGITLLDAEIAKKFSPYLSIEAGKYWSAYTYEYYDDIAKYLLPDLSAAEWAFSLGRQTGVRASGTAGNLTYRLSVSNAIPGSDDGTTENSDTKLATVLNLEYNILAPYGYQETDPSASGATKPELSLWASGMYNPVNKASVFENEVAGDRTSGATASLNYRYGPFSFQGSGYYKHNPSLDGLHAAFNSSGWQEQAGYYLVPGKFELAERVDGVNWGYGEIPQTGGEVNQWFAGPSNFSFSHLREYTGGLNYYLHGNNAKLQLQFSHLDAKGFTGLTASADRLVLQSQLAF